MKKKPEPIKIQNHEVTESIVNFGAKSTRNDGARLREMERY